MNMTAILVHPPSKYQYYSALDSSPGLSRFQLQVHFSAITQDLDVGEAFSHTRLHS